MGIYKFYSTLIIVLNWTRGLDKGHRVIIINCQLAQAILWLGHRQEYCGGEGKIG